MRVFGKLIEPDMVPMPLIVFFLFILAHVEQCHHHFIRYVQRLWVDGYIPAVISSNQSMCSILCE